jgi:general secretion pathway protein K
MKLMHRTHQANGLQCSTHAQRGAALLAAMLIVTLVASFAAAAAWQQWRAVEIEAAERQRVQTGWLLAGALDWTRIILREDCRPCGADYLGEIWALPLPESRISSFLAADKNNTALTTSEDDIELFLSGQIVDMQSRMNVLNLVNGGKISATDLSSFSKLFAMLNLDQTELFSLSDNLLNATLATTPTNSNQPLPLLPQRVAQLTWLGVSSNTLEKLKPFITVLPVRTPVNINTAPAEVLYASVPSLDLSGARLLESRRAQKHFSSIADAEQLVPAITGQMGTDHSIATRFFEIRGRFRLRDTTVQERSLVQRDGLTVKTLWRERATLPKFEAQASLQ